MWHFRHSLMPKYLPHHLDGADLRGIEDLIRTPNEVCGQGHLCWCQKLHQQWEHFSRNAQTMYNYSPRVSWENWWHLWISVMCLRLIWAEEKGLKEILQKQWLQRPWESSNKRIWFKETLLFCFFYTLKPPYSIICNSKNFFHWKYKIHQLHPMCMCIYVYICMYTHTHTWKPSVSKLAD